MSPTASTPTPRSVLAAAWPLFQVSWPGCLPLALIGVAAGGSPQLAALNAGEPRGLVHSGEWWGLYVATALLTLICHGAIVLRQNALAAGERLSPFDAMRRAALRLPQSVATAVLLAAPVALVMAMALARVNAFVLALAGVLAVGILLVFAFAWPAALLEPCDPWSALRRGLALVRGRLRLVLMLELTAFAVVLVFVLLASILFSVVMSIAGMQNPSGAGQLGISRLLIAPLMAFPLIWLAAVWVTAYREFTGQFTAQARAGQP